MKDTFINMGSTSVITETRAGLKLYVCYDHRYVTEKKEKDTKILTLIFLGEWKYRGFLFIFYFLIFYSEHTDVVQIF